MLSVEREKCDFYYVLQCSTAWIVLGENASAFNHIQAPNVCRSEYISPIFLLSAQNACLTIPAHDIGKTILQIC